MPGRYSHDPLRTLWAAGSAALILCVSIAGARAAAADLATRAGPEAVGPAAVTIEGHVRDARSGAALGGAHVFVSGTVIATRTDASGRYRLEIAAEARRGTELTLVARALGYAESRRTLDTSAGGTFRADFELSPAPIELDPVEVKAPEEGPPPAVSLDERAAGQVMMNILPSSAAGIRLRRDPDFNTESYARIDENRWRSPEREPLSTFSIDVDRASYSNVRRFITGGERPPVDAVRIEELINYFPYDYPAASEEHPFGVSAEVAPAPWNERHLLVRIGIAAERVDLSALPPSNFVFLLDVSGSMQAENKLPLLKRSLRLLVNELRPEDRVAIVVYAGAAGLVLESTGGAERGRILEAIEALEAGGSTAGGAGLELAYRVAARNHVARGNNRVILATDGDFNVGPSSDGEMTRLIEEKRAQGTFLTVLGFGMGNLKDSKMEALADHGNGNYAYIDNLLEARKVLVEEMGGTLVTIASDVKIQVEFNPDRVQAYRLIGYENRLLAAEDFNDDTKDAGELGAGHTVTALYEVVPPGAPPVEAGSVDPLRYGPRGDAGEAAGGDRVTGDPSGRESEGTDELLFVKIRYKAPGEDRSRLLSHPVGPAPGGGSSDLRFAASVAAFGMLLRDSEHCGDFTLGDVIRLARGSVGDDPHGYRSEFVRLVETTRDLGLLGEPRLTGRR